MKNKINKKTHEEQSYHMGYCLGSGDYAKIRGMNLVEKENIDSTDVPEFQRGYKKGQMIKLLKDE